MRIMGGYARLNRQDITDLNNASEQLAALAALIKRANPQWCDAAVANLIAVNNTIVRLQNKGAAAIARHLERHGIQEPSGETEAAGADEPSNPGQKVDSGEDVG